MMNASWLALSLLLSAQVEPAGAAPSAAPAEKTSADLVKEAFRLVEVEANTAQNLKQAVELYDRALADPALPKDARVRALIDQSRAWLRLGDLHTKSNDKVAAYEKGQAAGDKARALAPKSAEAAFWATANLASVGQARGVMNSLFMVGDVKKGLEEALRLDPNHAYARETLAKVYHVLPGLVGGDDDKAEALFLENLKRHPHFTPTMVELGRFYRDKGRTEEARAMFQRVLAEKSPELPTDWRKFNAPDARRELAKLEGK